MHKENESAVLDVGGIMPPLSGGDPAETVFPQRPDCPAKQPDFAEKSHHLEPEHERKAILRLCLCRIRKWIPPPHWSFQDWSEEISAQVQADAWKAEIEFDPLRGVPIARFICSRVMAGMLTRYRQEWRYGRRNLPDSALTKGSDDLTPSPSDLSASHDSVVWALMQLPESERSFIRQLFWGESTEMELAEKSRISHQAVNKRKRKILEFLRGQLSAG